MILWLTIVLFVLSIGLISWGADKLIDVIEEISKFFHFASVPLAFLILGIDLEESTASWFASAANMPEIALGNVIGNSIISISLCFALPALFFEISFKKISPRYFWYLFILGLLNAVGLIFPQYLWIGGIGSLVVFIIYGWWNFHRMGNQTLQTTKENSLQKKFPWKDGILGIMGLVALLGGSELLILSITDLILVTGWSEAVFGVGIIAAATNIEEYFLLFSSIRKKVPEIGIAGLIGKVLWNLGVTYGISALILLGFPTRKFFSITLMIQMGLLLVIIIPYFTWIGVKKVKLTRKGAIVFLVSFFAYLSILIWI
ncbi:MAG: sodium:calcium antiporter [Promethearchaeota archaeon]